MNERTKGFQVFHCDRTGNPVTTKSHLVAVLAMGKWKLIMPVEEFYRLGNAITEFRMKPDHKGDGGEPVILAGGFETNRRRH